MRNKKTATGDHFLSMLYIHRRGEFPWRCGSTLTDGLDDAAHHSKTGLHSPTVVFFFGKICAATVMRKNLKTRLNVLSPLQNWFFSLFLRVIARIGPNLISRAAKIISDVVPNAEREENVLKTSHGNENTCLYHPRWRGEGYYFVVKNEPFHHSKRSLMR